jgi:hypothetical protein
MRQIKAPIIGYKINIVRGIVPLGFPCRSKCAGRGSGKELHRTIIAIALMARIKIGINQPRLIIIKVLIY